VANGVTYVTANTGRTSALNAKTGALLWSYQTTFPISPSVVNGMVFVGDNWNGSVYAFGLP
jgi:outer membrane protein assembly factor BamB